MTRKRRVLGSAFKAKVALAALRAFQHTASWWIARLTITQSADSRIGFQTPLRKPTCPSATTCCSRSMAPHNI